MDLQGKKVLVFGAGISGIGSCGLLEKEGAEVILYDGNDKKDAEAMKAQLGEGKQSPRCSRSFSGRGDGKS